MGILQEMFRVQRPPEDGKEKRPAFADADASDHGAHPLAHREVGLLPSQLGPTVRKLLIVFGAVMVLVELTQARKNWYEGNTAKETERLARIQQEREQAEIEVAESASRKNTADELKAIADREAGVMAAIKPVQEGWGSPVAQAASANMARYQDEYAKLKRQVGDCERTKRCAQSDLERLTGKQDIYRMLFYSTRGSLYHHIERTSGKVTLPSSFEIDQTDR